MMCFGMKDRKRLKTNHCVIVLLDDTQLVHELHPTSTGQDLLDVVIKHLNLLETSYFGLKYYSQEPANSDSQSTYQQYAATGAARRAVWLEVDKNAIKQLRNISPMTVHFGVKYYARDPCKLAEEITRYQFFLQCKRDILESRLPVSFDLAIELFALAIQSELGDFDPSRHHDNYAAEFAFVPQQTLELERAAALVHRQQLVGQVPATAELNFLEKIKWLDMYGCELHPIQYDEGDQLDQYAIGLNPSGVLVLRNKLKVAQYAWMCIVKSKCHGRCFLMDVIEASGDQPLGPLGPQMAGKTRSNKSCRFGFRLADKEASRRLRWAIEEHRHFYHLISSSSAGGQLSQLARRQHQAAMEAEQQMKFGQRFRNSIRSAISLGAHFQAQQQQLQQQSQQLVAMQQKLHRSSIKSLGQPQAGGYQDYRPPPTVVRMPSRRYSNRSLPRQATNGASYQQILAAGNGNGLPAPQEAQSAAQQAMLVQMAAAQFHGQQAHQARSQTLRPISSKEAKQRGASSSSQYYHMMMMMAAQQQQQQQQQNPKGKRNSQMPEVSILPPGQHIVQPSIYRASSVIDGINQFGGAQNQQQHQPIMMQQFFNKRAQYPSHQAGHESPRSTKSAMVTSSALKLAGKKLARQQRQLLLYGNTRGAADARPLLGYAGEPASFHLQEQQLYSNGQQCDFYSMGANSASNSPRSSRSVRLLSSALKHRSKSTCENLNILHQQQMVNNLRQSVDSKMLLATAMPLNEQPQDVAPVSLLPPPDYNNSTPVPRQYASNTLGGKKKLPPPPPKVGINSKLAYGIEAEIRQQARAERSRQNSSSLRKRSSRGNDDDNYYCSRSDCSSIGDGSSGPMRGQAGTIHKASAGAQHQDWTNIRGRHIEFSHGKGPISYLDQQQQMIDSRTQKQRNQEFGKDTNNNSFVSAQAQIKNMSNKQATPILLSMNQAFSECQSRLNPNNKAMQLLNQQRQQLNSQSSEGSANRTASGTDSVPSSVASSPKSPLDCQPADGPAKSKSSPFSHHNTADSTASNSTTTSGYYGGSNSTGPASVDSDTLIIADTLTKQQVPRRPIKVGWTPNTSLYAEGTRAKIALGTHSNPSGHSDRNAQAVKTEVHHQSQQQRFYLGDAQPSRSSPSQPESAETSRVESEQHKKNWTNFDQLQLQPHATSQSCLKYVSFDV